MEFSELRRYARKGVQYVAINICNTCMNSLVQAMMNGCEFAYFKEKENGRIIQTEKTDR